MPRFVAYLEWLAAARRGGHHRLRHLYLLVLAVELGFFGVQWLVRAHLQHTPGTRSPAEALMLLAGAYFEVFAWQHVVLVALITPALAGGSITEEKTRGTLGLLLATPITPGEVIIGKAVGALAQVMLLGVALLPVLVFLVALSGMPHAVLPWWLVETAGLTLVLTATAILASAVARTTTRALAATYLLVGLAFLAVLFFGESGWLPVTTPRQWRRLLGGEAPVDGSSMLGLVVAAALSVGVLALACWRLRPAHERFLVGAGPRQTARFTRPGVGQQPLRWKENHVGHMAAFTFLRRWPRFVKAGLVCAAAAALAYVGQLGGAGVLCVCLLLVLGPGMLIGVRSAAVISGERENQTWDILRTTPLTVRQIVRGKLWGVIDGARPYMIPLLAVGAILCGLLGGAWYVVAALLAWAMGWGFLYFQAANGVYWSARCASSWQALLRANGSALWTLTYRSYFAGVFGLVITSFCITLFPLIARTWVPYVLLAGLGLFLPIVATLFSTAEMLLQKTEDHLAEKWGEQ